MSNKLFDKYADKLPKGLVDFTDAILADGFIRLCNPDTYKDVLEDGYSESDTIIIGTTVFGDFIVWEKQKYVNLISFSKHSVTVLESGFDFFFDDIEDERFLKQYFEYELYQQAVNCFGECSVDECYTINPIPAVGGSATIDRIQIGKVREYNAISIEMAGKIM